MYIVLYTIMYYKSLKKYFDYYVNNVYITNLARVFLFFIITIFLNILLLYIFQKDRKRREN